MSHQSSLLNFFDQTYIINLPERSDRRKEMERELGKLSAVLPSERVTIFPAVKPTDKGKFPSIGARGCFLSHLAVLTEARDRGLKSLLIMEDDLSFSNLLLKQQDTVVNQVQQLEWDFLYLGHGLDITPTKTITFQEYAEPLRLAHFLAINGRTLPALVNFLEIVLERPGGHPEGGPMHVDGAYTTFRKQNPTAITLIANPSLGFQRSSPSNIAGYHWFDHVAGVSQIVSTARKVKTWYKRAGF